MRLFQAALFRTTLFWTVWLLALAIGSPTQARELSPTWSDLSRGGQPEVYKVEQFLGAIGDTPVVVMAAGRASGLVVGTQFKTYRLTIQGRPIWVETGHLKIVEVQEEAILAEVDGSGSLLAKTLFPKFPGVMAGDLAVAQRFTLNRRQVLTPTVTLSYGDLFEDPKANPVSFELKAAGLTQLREATQTFAAARLGLLMIEGHTDHEGPSSISQIESYQRALAVRQMLIDDFGFDEKRVIAVGYGDAEPIDTSMAPGHSEINRRIVMKVVPMPQ